MLTGKRSGEHGIVGNGWFDRSLQEVHFWKQSNRLVHGPMVWDYLNRHRLQSLLQVLNIRLRESIREEKGGVYSIRAIVVLRDGELSISTVALREV